MRSKRAARAASLPRSMTLDELRAAAARCTACDLYKRATQTVFGEGQPAADIVLVGEQPGNDEDLAGRPFVGPAGRILEKALERAGIRRDRVYITNAVKHFKWKSDAAGKRRIHERPRQDEIEACRPWFQGELWAIRPRLVVCLGATAAAAVLGRRVTIRAARGQDLVSRDGIPARVTVHPSAILRMPDAASRRAEMDRFVSDLRTAARVASRLPPASGTNLAG